MYLPTKGTLLKRSVKDFFDDVYAICFLIFFIKAYVVGTHLNFFFLIWVLRPFQEYFTYIEPIVHRRWAKTGVPGEKPPDHP